MKKYYLDYREEWATVRSVIEEVIEKVTDGDKSDPVFKKEISHFSPNLIAYIAQTTIKAWEDEKTRIKS